MSSRAPLDAAIEGGRGLRLPPPLAPGDWIAVVAPASPFPRAEFWRGLAWLRDRYRVKMREAALDRDGFLAGTDETRARLLGLAMTDPDVKAVVAARGGYGVTRILDRLPWDAFACAPKWLVGFSDVTALHVAAASHGIASAHAPNVTGLGVSHGAPTTPWTRARWLAALERPSAPQEWQKLEVIREGSAAGPLVGGNLALLEAMAAAGRLRLPHGAILALEDVTERPYRVDRMLTALRDGGHLTHASAIVFGEFAQCDPGPDGVAIAAVLAERTRDLGIPVVAGAPFGHGARNDAFVHGAAARLRGDALTIGDPR
jgi:muramoyltetrapeptide carboxypeptidase